MTLEQLTEQFTQLQQRHALLEKSFNLQQQMLEQQQQQYAQQIGNFIGLQSMTVALVRCLPDQQQFIATLKLETEDTIATLLAESTLPQNTLNQYQTFIENAVPEINTQQSAPI